jgi:cellulose synthase (UDP-forming)
VTHSRARGLASIGQGLLAALMIGALASLATVPLSWKQQAILGGLMFAVALIVHHRSPDRRATLVMVLISVFLTSRYAYWRVSETYGYLSVNWSQTHPIDLFFVFLLLGAEAYTVVIMLLGYFQCVNPLQRKAVPLPEDTDLWPSVDVFIPTYNEPLEVIKSTVFAAMNMDWPADRLRVYILDDGKRPEVHTFAAAVNVGYVTRLDHVHAKAGNINNALEQTQGEFVAIFDSDHIATRPFLQVTMGWFLKDPRLALLQTPHHFYSADPFERNLGTFRRVPPEGELFYGIVQRGNDFWNSAFFCGSCAVLRRSALEEVGGIAVETVTEDSHTAFRLQQRGWNSAYIGIPLAGGLATSSVADHVQQRIRWARGMIQVLRLEKPIIARGLKWPQRLCYFNSVIHFLHATPRLVFLTAPLVYLLLGRSNLYGYVWTIMAYVIPHMFTATLTNSRVQGGHRHSFWNEVYETVLAPFILFPTLLALINPAWGKFNVTPKKTIVDRNYFSLRMAAPCIILLLLNLAAIGTAVSRMYWDVEHRGTLVVNVMWASMNSLVLGAAVAAAWEKRQQRTSTRIDVRLPMQLLQTNGPVFDGVTDNISLGGAAVQLNLPCHLREGEVAHMVFRYDGEDRVFPVEVVQNRGLRMRVRFALKSLEQESALTQIIFSRADSWLHWTDGRAKDRPVHSLLSLMVIAARGILSLPKALLIRPRADAPQTGARMRPGWVLPGVFLGLVLLAFALRAADAPAGGTRALNFTNTLDLASLGQTQPMTLRGMESRVSLYFAIPITKVVDTAGLHLRFHVSSGYQPESSRLSLILNGTQVAMTPLKQPGTVDQMIELPSDLLVSDNTLTFQLAGHCAGNCADATRTASVQIDRSTQIQLNGALLTLANDLKLLPAPFFDRSMQRGMHLSFAFSGKPDHEMLEAAGVVASWFGLLADDRGVRYSVSSGDWLPGGNVVLIAAGPTHWLPDTVAIDGPTAFVRENPSDAFGKLLVIAGRNGSESLRAAQALVASAISEHKEESLPSELHVPASFRLPASRVPFDAPRWANPDKRVVLGVNQSAEQLHVFGSGTVSLYFRLPPDLFFGPRNTIPLRLNFRTSGLADPRKSEIRVRLNNVWVTGRRISPDSATGVDHENIQLPVAALYPNNALTVEFVFEGKQESAENSEVQYPEAVVLTTSELDLRGVPRYVRLPRLELFATAGFPFTRFADLAQTAFVLPKNASPEEIATFLNISGSFGAETGYPGFRVTVLDPDSIQEGRAKDLLLIGTPKDQPFISQWSRHMPVHLDGAAPFTPESLMRFTWIPWSRVATERGRYEDLLANGATPEATIVGFESPLAAGRSVVALAASDANDQDSVLTALGGSGRIADVFGNVVVLQSRRIYSFQLSSDSYIFGRLSWRDAFNDWMAGVFWLIPIVVLICIAPLAKWCKEWSDRRAAIRLELQGHA